MDQCGLFSILDSVDSTNNYAMGQVHAGLAKHGMAWFAANQTAGKGQRGKAWQSNPGDNIILSIAITPPAGTQPHQFFFNAAIALACSRFLETLTGVALEIKWPNDIYWRDRKAGGILIENVLQGNQWKWAVIGIGINVNQTRFSMLPHNPVSVKEITGNSYDAAALAKQLHLVILDTVAGLTHIPAATLIADYNAALYKKGKDVQLRKNNIVFKTNINKVDEFGNLLTRDAIERSYMFGEVEWIIEGQG
jgi:BirA family biotin operon repressor/biotin-[acetyl-CoA-carboxylase] ligase